MLATMEAARPAWLVDVGLEGAANAERIGRKAANLAVMMSAGLSVPPGFAITTEAYDAFLAAAPGPRSMERLLERPLPEGAIDAIKHVMRTWGDVPLAVRSSSVSEDLEGASFAGQYESVLNVRGEKAVAEAVRRCWASAYSPRILRYAEQYGIADMRMAVLLQPLVPANCAGVAFTVNPVTGNADETVVSVVRGLGDKLVSGEASPDEWIVRAGHAEAIGLPEAAATKREVLKVAELARRAERLFGCPQDIEWAISGGKIYLLQARPITALGTAAQEASLPIPIEIPDGYWEREASHCPKPLSPFMSSLYLPAVNEAMKHMFDRACLMIETIALHEIGGYVYQRVVPYGGKDRKPLPKPVMRFLLKSVPVLRKRMAGCREFVESDGAAAIIDQWHTHWKPELQERIGSAKAVRLHELNDEALVRHLRTCAEFLQDGLRIHMLVNGALNTMLAEFAFGCRDLLGWEFRYSVELLNGLSSTSSEPSRELSRLADYIRKRPALAAMLEESDRGSFEALRSADPTWAGMLDDYLTNYGYRAIRYEVADPILLENSALLLQLLKDQVNGGYDPQAEAAALAGRREARKQEALNRLAGRPDDLSRFMRILQRAERAYPVREEHGFFDASTSFAMLRLALLEIGGRLERGGWIDRADQVFFLRYPETLASFDSSAAIRFRRAIEQRNAERNWALTHPGPASYGKTPPPPPPADVFDGAVRFAHESAMWSIQSIFAASGPGAGESAQTGELRGIPASAGVYTGTVRVVNDESEFHKIRQGDVLVCPITSPVWSVLFPSIGALVTDTGGILSHSAIIAREYRLPSVVSAGSATRRLQDGQTVTVDGNAGVISIVA